MIVMKILLADQHRDMLLMYRALLEQRGDEIVTAFDGTHGELVSKIINADIPRVQSSQLLKMARDRRIGTVKMVNAPGVSGTTDNTEQHVILFPFFPEELFAKIEEACPSGKACGGVDDE